MMSPRIAQWKELQNTSAWKLLVDEAHEKIEALYDSMRYDALCMEDIERQRGALDMLEWIITMPAREIKDEEIAQLPQEEEYDGA
jgi:hypothetical protein